MHEIYTTEGLILSSQKIGEANKFFKILTKDFGLINATAQGVLHTKSKLRFSLQDFSFAKISFVNGREIWRITNASPDKNILTELSGKDEELNIFLNIINLVKRLVHGEEEESKLFEIIKSGFDFIIQLSKDQMVINKIKSVENILILRILYTLGYLNKDNRFDKLSEGIEYGEELLSLEQDNRKEIIKTINEIFNEIHL